MTYFYLMLVTKWILIDPTTKLFVLNKCAVKDNDPQNNVKCTREDKSPVKLKTEIKFHIALYN